MRVRPFLQSQGERATIENIKKLVEFVEPEEILFCFAYATASGCAEFQRRMGDDFWDSYCTSWLFGIDYGRTHPTALQFVSERNNASVKIMNGTAVVISPAFVPLNDFHMKACFARNRSDHKYGLIVGSGNFSRSGLISNTECGVLLTTTKDIEFASSLQGEFQRAWELWELGDDLATILDTYKAQWTKALFKFPDAEEAEETSDAEVVQHGSDEYRFFWIDAGYVTQNRGPSRPGNQFDLPRGAHRFFGFNAAANQARNTVIGEIPFVLPGGILVRALRLGNNHMEKITLPIPEDYGFGAYDGTIIEFERIQNGFRISTSEPDDYLFAHGRDDDFVMYRMGSGRPYGYRGL